MPSLGDRPDRFAVAGIGQWKVEDSAGGYEAVARGAVQRTLAVLVANGARGIDRDTLHDGLFPDKPPDPDGARIRVRMSRVRAALPDGAIPEGTNDGWYQLDLRSDQVDLWHLAAVAADSADPVTQEQILWALAGEPYAGIELPANVAQAYYSARRAQRVVAERFCRSEPSSISFEAGERLLWFASSDPFDEKIVTLVARTLADAGHGEFALTTLRTFIERFESEVGYRPDEAEALHTSLQHRPVGQPGPPIDGGHPPELRRFRDRIHVGREAELDRLVGHGVGLVTGPRGGGKSHLLAEIAARELAAGNEVTYMAAHEDADMDFGPFLTTFPQLESAADPTGDDGALVSQIWKTTLELLRPSPGVGHRRLLIDDAQWLDRRSAAVVHLLASAASSRPLAVTVAGRVDDGELEWHRLQQRLAGLSAEQVELIALDLDALMSLVGAAHPATTEQARRSLAAEVFGLTGGLPIAAQAVIDKIDPNSLLVPEHIERELGLGWLIGEFDDVVRRVGLAAAVLGLSFDQHALLSICDDDEKAVLEALDHLVDAGLVYLDVDRSSETNRFVFDHVLAQQAFLVAPPNLTRRLYLAAAEQTGDLHARARYLTRAGRPYDGAVAALLASAAEHADRGGWWAAAKQLRLAESIDADQLTAIDHTRFATALDLSGQDGTAPRRRAFALASAQGDWHQALEAVLAGLPSAERPDGDEVRLSLLSSVPADRLEPADRFRHAHQLARLLSLSGADDQGIEWADTALTLANGPAEQAEAHVALWTARHHLRPEPHLFPSPLVDEARRPIRARIWQMQAITALEGGDLAEASRIHAQFQGVANELNDPLRIWHAMTFDSLLAFDRGQWAASDRLSERAHQYGLLHGHQEATSVRAGQLFVLHFAAGREGDLLPVFDLVPANIRRSALASAAFVLAMAAAGDRDEARRQAVELVADAMLRPRSLSIVVTGLLAPLIAETGRSNLIDDCRKFLLPFANRSIVVGFGIANMGPLWRYLIPLAESESERRRWLELAARSSKQLGSPTWTVLNLMTLAAETGDDAPRLEAEQLCRGTDILQMPS